MSVDIYIYPILDIEKLKKDDNLVVETITCRNDEQSYAISLKEEMQSEDGNTTSHYGFILTYDLSPYTDYTLVKGYMFPLLKYLFEKHNLLFGFDGGLKDAGYIAMSDYYNICRYHEDEEIYVDPIFIEYATNEMITCNNEYKWSDDSLKKLIKMNEDNKEDFNEFIKKYLPEYNNVTEDKNIDSDVILNDDGLPF